MGQHQGHRHHHVGQHRQDAAALHRVEPALEADRLGEELVQHRHRARLAGEEELQHRPEQVDVGGAGQGQHDHAADGRQEAAAVGKMTSYPVSSLKGLLLHFGGEKPFEQIAPLNFEEILSCQEAAVDFADIIGQDNAKRALVIAAAGGHKLFMQGPPGAGKTMLAQTIPGILPALTEKEALEVTKIYSVAGLLADQS